MNPWFDIDCTFGDFIELLRNKYGIETDFNFSKGFGDVFLPAVMLKKREGDEVVESYLMTCVPDEDQANKADMRVACLKFGISIDDFLSGLNTKSPN